MTKEFPKLRQIISTCDNEFDIIADDLCGQEPMISVTVDSNIGGRYELLFSEKLLNAEVDWIENGEERLRLHIRNGWDK